MDLPVATSARAWSAFRRDHARAAAWLVALLTASVALALMPSLAPAGSPADGEARALLTVEGRAPAGSSTGADVGDAELPEEPEDDSDEEREELGAIDHHGHDWVSGALAARIDVLTTHRGPSRAHGAELERPPRDA